MVARLVAKTHLSAKGLIEKVRGVFKNAKEPKKGGQGHAKEISLVDCLSSALAIFKLKFPSLLQFDDALMDNHIKQNIKNLFDLENIPCDTYMRERLDEVNPRDIRPAFSKVFSTLQRGKELEKFVYLDGKYLLLNDGTRFFSSKNLRESFHSSTNGVEHINLGLLTKCPLTTHTKIRKLTSWNTGRSARRGRPFTITPGLRI